MSNEPCGDLVTWHPLAGRERRRSQRVHQPVRRHLSLRPASRAVLALAAGAVVSACLGANTSFAAKKRNNRSKVFFGLVKRDGAVHQRFADMFVSLYSTRLGRRLMPVFHAGAYGRVKRAMRDRLETDAAFVALLSDVVKMREASSGMADSLVALWKQEMASHVELQRSSLAAKQLRRREAPTSEQEKDLSDSRITHEVLMAGEDAVRAVNQRRDEIQESMPLNLDHKRLQTAVKAFWNGEAFDQQSMRRVLEKHSIEWTGLTAREQRVLSRLAQDAQRYQELVLKRLARMGTVKRYVYPAFRGKLEELRGAAAEVFSLRGQGRLDPDEALGAILDAGGSLALAHILGTDKTLLLVDAVADLIKDGGQPHK